MNVEEGTTFCPHCNAPQIRVAPSVSDSPAFPPNTPDHVQPPAQPVPLGETAGQAPPAPAQQAAAPAGINWSSALPVAAAVGVVFGLAWALAPWSWSLLVVMAGVLAVCVYRLRSPGAPISKGMGARIGAVCGVFSFVIFAIGVAVTLLGSRATGALRSQLQHYVQQVAAQNPDPRVQEMMMRLASPQGLALVVTLTMVVLFIGFLILSSIGGALGAAWFGRSPDRR